MLAQTRRQGSEWTSYSEAHNCTLWLGAPELCPRWSDCEMATALREAAAGCKPPLTQGSLENPTNSRAVRTMHIQYTNRPISAVHVRPMYVHVHEHNRSLAFTTLNTVIQ